MSTSRIKTHRPWLKAGLLVLASPAFAFLPFLLVAFLALLLQPVNSLAEWLATEPFLRAAGFAAFSTLLSIDSMLRSFYWTVPVMLAGTRAVLITDFGFQTRAARLGVAAVSVGVLYATTVHIGFYFGWLNQMFWT